MAGPVLIIEDDPDIAEVLKYGLEKENFHTRVALNGEDGLNFSLDRYNPPSLILLDLLLPNMSGIELCRRLRHEPRTARTPIVVVSAKAFENELLVSKLAADAYILKPFLIKDVVAQVRLLLSLHS